jgi:hypothetical protein
MAITYSSSGDGSGYPPVDGRRRPRLGIVRRRAGHPVEGPAPNFARDEPGPNHVSTILPEIRRDEFGGESRAGFAAASRRFFRRIAETGSLQGLSFV